MQKKTRIQKCGTCIKIIKWNILAGMPLENCYKKIKYVYLRLMEFYTTWYAIYFQGA